MSVPLSRPAASLSIWQARNFLKAATARGVDLVPLLVRLGATDLIDGPPAGRIDVVAFARVLKALQHEMRDEFFGLVSHPVRQGTLSGVLNRVLLCSTLGEALAAGFEQYRMVIDDFRLRLDVRGDRPAVASIAVIARSGRSLTPFLQAALMYWTLGMASWLVGSRVPALDVSLRTEGPLPREADPAGKKIFGVPERFHTDVPRVLFQADCLKWPVVATPADKSAFLSNVHVSLLNPFRLDNSLEAKVRQRLYRDIGHSLLSSVEGVAASLNLAPHTLRRRLTGEGKRFQDIKNDVRRDLARRLLEHSSRSLDDIASRLGFSDCSTFNRSFKAWTGISPGQYRQRALALHNKGR